MPTMAAVHHKERLPRIVSGPSHLPPRGYMSRGILKTVSRLSRQVCEVPHGGRREKARCLPALQNDTIGTNAKCRPGPEMSASLIGRLGSSAFRLSTVSMSLVEPCFSSESAPGPFHHGFRGRGGTICWSALPSYRQEVQRTRLIHRPARDIIPPPGAARNVLLFCRIRYSSHAAAAACSRVHRNSAPSTQMRCMITAPTDAPAPLSPS
jgi:hypothetical protein